MPITAKAGMLGGGIGELTQLFVLLML